MAQHTGQHRASLSPGETRVSERKGRLRGARGPELGAVSADPSSVAAGSASFPAGLPGSFLAVLLPGKRG